MNAVPSLEVLHAALGPVEELRGDHSQLESTMRESLAELETLHDELTQWQRDLTRQQAELDQRAAAAAEQRQWGEQLRELCRLVERQGAMLESLGARAPEDALSGPTDAEKVDEAPAGRSKSTRRMA
jgi:chromosome segregation ATPase